MNKTFFCTMLFAAVLGFSSCTTSPICVTSSVTPMQGKVVSENMGKVEGRDTAFSILGLYMIGRPDLSMAIDDALKKKGGDTLINISCYETFGWFLLFSTNTVKVEGEAVKFTVEAPDVKDSKKDKKK